MKFYDIYRKMAMKQKIKYFRIYFHMVHLIYIYNLLNKNADSNLNLREIFYINSRNLSYFINIPFIKK
jgi:hypothetical protein